MRGNRSIEKTGLKERLKKKTIISESALRQRQCRHVELKELGWVGGGLQHRAHMRLILSASEQSADHKKPHSVG